MKLGDARLACLLEELQQDFPAVPRPFLEIGRRCGLGEEEALESTRALLAEGLIREITALLDGRRLGFRSCLVALRAGDRAEELAGSINRHPGVSHNYLRDHAWNLWFTLAVPSPRELADEVARLAGPVEALILPAVRTFKLRVHLPFSREAPSSGPQAGGPQAGGRETGRREAGQPQAAERESPGTTLPAALSPFETRLLERLENPLPLVPEPWQQIAGTLRTAEAEVLAAMGELKEKGVLRRIAAVLHHRRAGFQANAMVCFRLPGERLAEAGLKAARLHQVSHCYQRETRPQWPYSLYAMVHARTREDCDALVRELAADIGGEEHQVLYSVRELKKQRIKYFGFGASQ